MLLSKCARDCTLPLKGMSFVPCTQEGYETHYLSDPEDQAELFDFLEGLSPNVKIDEAGVVSEKA